MDNNPIDLSKLLNFSDTTPLSNVIAMIGQLNTLYSQLIQSAQSGASAITQSMQSIQKSVDSLEQSMVEADVQTKKGQETISKGAEATAKNVQANEEYKKSLADLTAQIKLLQDQQDKLNDSKDKGTKSNLDQAGSLNDLRKQLADAVAAYSNLGKAVDQSVKDDSLKKIGELNAQVKAGTNAVNEAKKATDSATGSYNALQAQVSKATRELKAMEGGIGSNSEAFKKLQKEVLEGNNKLKSFDQAIGSSVREVGNYKDKIVEALGKFSPVAAEATETVTGLGSKLVSVLFNPITAAFAVIGAGITAAVSSVKLFYDDTIDGADASKTAFIEYDATIQVLKGSFKALGREINSALGLSDDESVVNNLIKITLLRIGDYTTLAKIATKEQEIKDIVKLQNDLKKEEIVLTVELAKNEDERQKALFEARNKIDNNDATRYAAIQQARKLQLENAALETESNKKQQDIQIAVINKKLSSLGIQINAETTINQLLESRTIMEKISYEDAEKLAAIKKKGFEIDQSLFQSQKRIQALEAGIIDDIGSKQIEKEKEVQEARQLFQESFYNHQIQLNQKIVGNSNFTLDQQLEAQQEVAEAEGNLAQLAAKKALAAARETALGKVELEQSAYEKIKAINDPNVKAAALRAAKLQELDTDTEFQKLANQITQDGINKDAESIRQGNIKKLGLVKQYFEDQLKIVQDQVSIGGANAKSDLAQGFLGGGSSNAQYTREKAELAFNIQSASIQKTIDIYSSEYFRLQSMAGANQAQLLDIEKKGKEAQAALDELYANRKLANAQKLNQALINLANAGLDAAKTIYDNEAQAKLTSIQTQLDALTKEKDAEVQLAGDNKTKVATINNAFARDEARLAKEQRKIQHDQAEYNKEIDAAKVISNTAVAVSAALETPIIGLALAATVAALGAVQLAAVLSTPIPGYYTGTESSRGGLAYVAERGGELAIDPQGEVRYYDKPQLVDLKQGTRILNAEKSKPIMNKMTSGHLNAMASDLRDTGQRDLTVVVNNDPELIAAVRANKPNDIVRQGLDIYHVMEARNGSKKHIRSKILS